MESSLGPDLLRFLSSLMRMISFFVLTVYSLKVHLCSVLRYGILVYLGIFTLYRLVF